MTVQSDQLKIGKDEAPVKLELFFNVACPFSAKFYFRSKDIIETYVEKNALQVIVKLWDKPKKGLLLGTQIHLSIDYSNPKETFQKIKSLLETQDEWKLLSNKELEAKLRNEYDLVEEKQENTEISLAVTKEALKKGVQYIPTVIINNELQQLPSDFNIKPLIEKSLEAVSTKSY